MGNNEGWAQPNGLMPNGLLPEEVDFVFRPIDSERWSKAEERTAQLIDCIQPNQPSEERRNAVAVYVQRLITKCFPCQVFTFGSVPLKTYLPDGDIDLTAFSENQNMDTWANQVRDTLESEEKDENAEFRVKEVQYIQAEVKLIKCLVENIVVDISFNQLGGLCTLCFLDEVDHLINQNHLFKRSIILIKAWCYYESRLLGAHHGLISTYALETLVLYIFHVFNNSFTGPLEVLYRFLEFFSKFDWDNFCVSLWGPIPITSLPDMTAEPPRKDSGELLLSKLFLDACNTVYAVFPGGQESQGQPFVSKYFNVIDPLRINNNLGRSVSKGNFYRIRGAFAYGAKRLATLLKSPKEELYNEVNDFFTNTWDRHSIGSRPDASSNNLPRLRLSSNPDHIEKLDTVDNKSVSKIINKKPSGRHTEIEMNHVSSQYSTSYAEKRQRSLVARTHSSPELTETLSDTSSQGRCNRAAGSGKIHISAAGLDAIRKNLGSEIFATQNNMKSVTDDPSSQSKSIQNSNDNDSDSVSVIEDPSFTIGTRGMLQEEQDLVNMMASASAPGFNGQVHMPMNFAPPHFRLPLSQSILTSMGYPHRNFAFPLIKNPWGNMQFPPGVVPSPMAHYFPGMRMTSNPDNYIDTDSGKYGSVVLSAEDTENGVWQEIDDGSTSGVDMNNGDLEMIRSDDQREDCWLAKENRWSTRKDHLNSSQHPENRGNEVYLDERIEITGKNPNVRTRSSSKTSSESSWDGTSTKASKTIKENHGLKTAPLIMSSSVHGKGKTAPEHLSYHGDESDRDSMNELSERSNGPPMNVLGHPVINSEPAETIVSDSVDAGSRHRAMDNMTFYPTGPPVPFITMLPFYNYPTDNNDSGQSIDSSVVASVKAPEEHKSDILHSDFGSHYENLQYGRFCQNPQYYYRPMVYPPPVTVPPMYLQGRNPWDSPGRPSSTNMNAFNQIMSYGPRFVPVAPLQPVSNRSSGAYQRYGDEMPRYRSGTGTYLPNHKASARDRHPTGTRRGNYSYDRSEHHGDRSDREGNWNINSKARSSVRSLSHSQSQTERSNGPFRLKSSQSVSLNTPYGMYPNGVSSNGHTVMMLYPYDQHSSYGTRAEQLEFGSLGPGKFSGINDVSHLSEGSRESGAFEEQRFHNSSVQRSSPDQPSSPVIQRRR